MPLGQVDRVFTRRAASEERLQLVGVPEPDMDLLVEDLRLGIIDPWLLPGGIGLGEVDRIARGRGVG